MLSDSEDFEKCRCCGKRTTGNIELCRPCEDDSGEENYHNDNHDDANPDTECPRCNGSYTGCPGVGHKEAKLLSDMVFNR